jgi:hypothetical protein
LVRSSFYMHAAAAARGESDWLSSNSDFTTAARAEL